MGRLKGQVVYLSGAMDNPASNGGADWREKITPFLHELGMGVFNPCDKPIMDTKFPETSEMRELINHYKKNGQYDKVTEYYKQVVHEDLRAVDNCHAVLVYLDIHQFPCGTYNEIYLAAEQKKPIMVVCPYGKSEVPNWLFGRIKHELFFSSFDECKDYLVSLDSGRIDDTLGRWVFFDCNKMFGLNNIE